MTTLEHVSVEPLSNVYRSSLGSGDGDEDVLEKDEQGVAVAVTTAEEEAAVEVTEAGRGEDGGVDHGDDVVGDAPVEDHSNARREDEGEDEALGRSRETLCSRSGSRSNSRSRSQSSVRVVGSSATSWTQVEEGRVSREGERAAEVACRSSADQANEVDVGREGAGAEVGHPRPGTGTCVREEEVLVMREEDIGEEWHPLRSDGKARSQDDEKVEEKAEGEEDVGSAPAESVRWDDRTLEINEKERWRTFGSSGRNSRHLRLEFKSSSPQPWDDIDPPAGNSETYASDYYSTLNSKKFERLQKSRRRPLIPHSSYYFGPPPPGSAYGTSPVGQIGVHHPREIVRIERDYTGGELVQFSPVFPLELEGRITPTQFHQTINDINEILISAHSIQYACLDNCLAVITLQLSSMFTTSHYTKEMRRLKRKIEEQNTQLYNPVGLNILWPRRVAFLFLELEYY